MKERFSNVIKKTKELYYTFLEKKKSKGIQEETSEKSEKIQDLV